MKKFSKKIFASFFYNRSNCPTGHIDRAPNGVVKQMISDAWNLTPEKHKKALESYDADFGMQPYPIQVTGLKALNKISNNRGKIAAPMIALPALFLAYKYGAFNKIGDIVKNCTSNNKTQLENYENQYDERETNNSDVSTDSEDD